MSQKPVTAGKESQPPPDRDQARFFPRQALPPIVDPSRFTSSRPSEHSPPAFGNPPATTDSPRGILSETSSNDAEQRPSRPIRMHSILNPPSAMEDRVPQRPPSNAESPETSISSASWRPSDRSTQSPSSISTAGTNLPGMRVHSMSAAPINRPPLAQNPAVSRVASLGSIGLPSATIDAKRSPFLSGRGHQYPPDVSNIPLPAVPVGYTPPVVSRTSYGFPMQKTSTRPDRRGLEVLSQAPASQSDSPSTSYSSYSQLSHPSPAPQQYHLPPTQVSSSAHLGPLVTTRGAGPDDHHITIGSERNYGPVTSAVGQSTYQLMTLDTDQGPIQVPVDVQAASKMADEKRKRNAGASARFRQRRKEKERESSQTISKLESQIREIGEEREYYRQERDYFRSLVYSTSAQGQVVPRLPSPRQRKLVHPEPSAPPVNGQWQQSEERGGQTGRNTRRRIGAYTPVYELPPSTMAAPDQTPIYSTSPSLPFAHPAPRAPVSVGRQSISSIPPPRSGPGLPSAPPSWNHLR
ncbi:MAG: hypothetical protein Q9187_003432 [Circinaria calcarea]